MIKDLRFSKLEVIGGRMSKSRNIISNNTKGQEERGGRLVIEWQIWRPRKKYWKQIGSGIVVGGFVIWKYLIN